MGKFVAIWGCLVASWSFAAASAQSPAPPGPQTALARVAAGKAVFGASCSNDYCHGPEGEGGGAPNLRERQLLDFVAFVKSMDPASRAGVTLKDLF